MYVQLTTGHDSFKATGSSRRRNVKVHTWTRVEDDGEGKQITPVFAAFQRRLKGFGKTATISNIPATNKFQENVGGQWFVSRHEILPFTEILIEYRHRNPEPGSFQDEVEYLLLIADQNGPLLRIRLEMPEHEHSAVPQLFFEGRFTVVTDDKQLDKKGREAWGKFLGVEDAGPGVQVSDFMDVNMDTTERYFSFIELEAAIPVKRKIVEVEKEDGTTELRIKRSRRIKLR